MGKGLAVWELNSIGLEDGTKNHVQNLLAKAWIIDSLVRLEDLASVYG